MMPFSVLRTWGLGLFSWAILGLGIYLLWEYADGMTRPEPQPTAQAQTVDDDAGAEEVPAMADAGDRSARLPADDGRASDRQGGWPYLIGGLALVLFSFGGFLPVLPFLGKPGLSEPKSDRTGQAFTIVRPDGARLHVETYGRDSGPTILFTHGWSLDSTAWYYAKEALGGSYRLVVWDLPGLGKSTAPTNGDFRIEKMASDLEAVLAAAAPSGPVMLVGHSIGGMITQTFCRLFPERLGQHVTAIALVHTTYTNPLRTAWLAPLWSALETPLIVPLNYLTIWLAPLAWVSNMQSYLNGTMHIITRFASFAGDQTWGQVNYGSWLAAIAWPGTVARGNLAMLEFDEQQTLPHISVPVLVIGGEHDRMTQRFAADRIDATAPHSVEATIPAGHLGFWEKHERVNEYLAEFAAQHLPTTPLDSAIDTIAAAEARTQKNG
jgi:pimeloyl-ACP methyl ester carboxylesterase